MQRRRFLTAIGGGSAAILGGAGYLFLRPTKPVALPAQPLLYFTPREFAIFTAVADTMIETPPDEIGADGKPTKPHCPTVFEAKVAEKADAYMARNVVDAQHDFHQLLGLFDNALAGFLFCGTIAPFSQMDRAARTAYLAKWESHSIPLLRTGFIGLKKLAMSCYYASPETWPSIHYPGPMEAE